MTDLILHKHENYISEDLAYYFSGQRDVNNQIRPKKNIYSLTPYSPSFAIDFNDGKVGNLFFPLAPYSIDRIYIGISFPLFANNWGTAFLRYLLTRVKPEGCVVLPVYPEMQASEKNLWSRSILENSFQSRSRWLGTSNLWAENDGVMSMRIGRKFPSLTPSTAAYFFTEVANNIVRHSLYAKAAYTSNSDQLFSLGKHYWHSANSAAIIERIIQDHFGRKRAVTLCELSNSNGLIAIECLLSQYITIKQAISIMTTPQASHHSRLLKNSFHNDIQDRFTAVEKGPAAALEHAEMHDVISIINYSQVASAPDKLQALLAKAWEKLSSGGILIVHDDHKALEPLLPALQAFGAIHYYSALVASRIQDGETISHYSSAIEEELVLVKKRI